MTTSPLKVEGSSSAKVRIAIQMLNFYMTMREGWLGACNAKVHPSWKGRFMRMANMRLCQGLVKHDRILTGKRPL